MFVYQVKYKGLIDEGETPEQAAIRELEEETGYVAFKVSEVSPTIVSDPGRYPFESNCYLSEVLMCRVIGMTNANMKLVVLDVLLPDRMETPNQKLESGEFIVRRVVELAKLKECLHGKHLFWHFFGKLL